MNKWKENTNKYIRKLILTKVGTWNWLRLARDLSMLCGTGGSNSGSKKKISSKTLQTSTREHGGEAKFYS